MQAQQIGNTQPMMYSGSQPVLHKRGPSAEILFPFLYRYDWSNGFDMPWRIIDSPCCDLSTALLAFDLVDGYAIFETKQLFHQEWSEFVYYLYNRIRNRDFLAPVFAYQPITTREMLVELKHKRPDIDPIFLYGTAGQEIDL